MKITPADHTDVYGRFRVKTIINASGPQTRLSGNLMHPDVAAAMASAATACVDMAELHASASDFIAQATGAEAGCVTAGGGAALMLGAAACMTGLDTARMNRLPDTSGMPNEFVMSRSQRNMYDRAVRQAGGRLIEVGTPDRVSGAGVRDAESWHFESAIADRTAAVLWFAQRNSEPKLEDLVPIARKYNIPVLVDAASQLPPKGNLRRFVEMGADLVVISGGKALAGPQGSGILAGKTSLILSAVLQMLDHDVFAPLWKPRGRLFQDLHLPTLPDHGIGRPAKVGKEQVIGLLTALERYQKQDEVLVSGEWRTTCEQIISAFGTAAKVAVAITDDSRRKGAYFVEVVLDEIALGLSALDVAERLQEGEPSIRVNLSRAREGILLLSPMCLRQDEAAILGEALSRAVLGSRANAQGT